jgi:hypothetical protein
MHLAQFGAQGLRNWFDSVAKLINNTREANQADR